MVRRGTNEHCRFDLLDNVEKTDLIPSDILPFGIGTDKFVETLALIEELSEADSAIEKVRVPGDELAPRTL